MKKAAFKFQPFTDKQKRVLLWWQEGSPHKDKNGIIAHGAIRSGKTLIMSLSFIIWAMCTFDEKQFGMAGKTIGSFKRNVWLLLRIVLRLRGYRISKIPDMKDAVYIRKGKIINSFYFFGGRDEASQDLVQGFTSAGFFFDEVTLMPQSFVNQAVARCSEEGSKLWFNCNPKSPFHYVKTDWIDKAKEKNLYIIHFELNDNPSLSESKKQFYHNMFTGVFFQRYILGLWVMAEGIIYSMFQEKFIIDKVPRGVKMLKKWVGVDYGQANATVFILCGLGSDGKFYILDEYYHEGRGSQIQKSPAGYAKEYLKWLRKNGVEGSKVKKESTFVDPSAKGFIVQLWEYGERDIVQADNSVLDGIELFSSMLENGLVRVLRKCKMTISEFFSYSWDEKAQERGEEKPIKKYDHCMDAIRYIINGTRKIWLSRIKIEEDKGDVA